MAKIPDKLIMDIRKFLDENCMINAEREAEADRYVYAIDLTVEYDKDKDIR